MSSFLKNYILTFKTKAPVYIGSGRTINKKEYIYDQRSGRIYVINIDQMYQDLCRLHMEDAYERYLLQREDTSSDLYHFLMDHHIQKEQFRNWIRYEESVGDAGMNIHSIKNICEFVKDPYGRPYIPGSSLKGALRTMLEVSYILRNRTLFDGMVERIYAAKFNNKRNYLSREDKELAQKNFHRELFQDQNGRYDIRNVVNDMMRGIHVSDSEPLEFRDLCICQKIDLNTDGVFNPLNVLRECIRPEVEISMRITVDSAYFHATNRDILNAVQDFYSNINAEFISKFPNVIPRRGNSATFYLGGGTGYPSKTVTYGLAHGRDGQRLAAHIINQPLPDSIRRKHGHDRDVERGASPHMLKCTLYQNQKYLMGECCITKI